MLDFQTPAALLLLLLIPLLLILRHLKILNKITFSAVLSDWEGKAFSWKGKSQKLFSALANICFISAFVSSIIAFSDPVISNQEKVFTSLGTDTVFVIDTSPSMSAKDMNGAMRLDAAKNTILTLTEDNNGCRFGLVALGSNAAVLVPPTNDRSFFLERLSQLNAGSFGNGSAIGDGLSTAVCHLASSTALKKCIILLTDGENNAGEIHPETAAKLSAENEINIYVVGIGTKGKVPIEYTDPATNKLYSGYLDSNFNPASLKKIAAISNGRYFEAQTIEELQDILKTVSKIEAVSQSYTYRTVGKSYFKSFLSLAIILFIISWIIRRIILKEMIYFKIKKSLLVRSFFLLIAFICLLLARAGISWGSYLIPVQKSGHSVSMVFDISNSMLAKDCPENTSRLEAASLFARKLLSRMEGISVSVILSKGDGIAAIPLTDDLSLIDSLLNVISPSLMTVPGSSIGKGIQKAKESFPQNYSTAGNIWVFTDGEETDGYLASALSECQKNGIPVTFIGFGSEKESEITAGDGKTKIMTALRRDRLEQVISEVSAKYRFFNSHAQLKYIDSLEKGSAIQLLSQFDHGSSSDKVITAYEIKPVPRFKLFLTLAVIALVLSYISVEFNFAKFFGKTSSETALICTIFLSIFLSSCSSETTSILQGTMSYHKKNYRKAVANFSKAAEKSTEKNNSLNISYAIYDLGTAYTMMGENDSALEKYKAVPDDAPSAVRYAAFYNAGVIAHRNSDYEQAQEYFRKALEIDSSHIEAKINLELSMSQISAKGHQKESQAIQASKPQNEQDPKDMEKAVFEHIKENDQKQWKNSEAPSDVNLAEDY